MGLPVGKRCPFHIPVMKPLTLISLPAQLSLLYPVPLFFSNLKNVLITAEQSTSLQALRLLADDYVPELEIDLTINTDGEDDNIEQQPQLGAVGMLLLKMRLRSHGYGSYDAMK